MLDGLVAQARRGRPPPQGRQLHPGQLGSEGLRVHPKPLPERPRAKPLSHRKRLNDGRIQYRGRTQQRRQRCEWRVEWPNFFYPRAARPIARCAAIDAPRGDENDGGGGGGLSRPDNLTLAGRAVLLVFACSRSRCLGGGFGGWGRGAFFLLTETAGCRGLRSSPSRQDPACKTRWSMVCVNGSRLDHSVGFVVIRAADCSVKVRAGATSAQAGPYQDNLQDIRPSGCQGALKQKCPARRL